MITCAPIKLLPDADLLRKILSYDSISGKLVWKHRPDWTFNLDIKYPKRLVSSWNSQHPGSEAFYTSNRAGYLNGYINGVPYLAHRIIWKIVTGEEPKFIDHINGVTFDNSWANLRSISRDENQKNTARPQRNTSGIMGVHWHTGIQKWTANITVGGRLTHLGVFDSKEDAAVARKSAENVYGYHVNHGRVQA